MIQIAKYDTKTDIIGLVYNRAVIKYVFHTRAYYYYWF